MINLHREKVFFFDTLLPYAVRALENRSTDVLKVEIWSNDIGEKENLRQRIGKASDIKDLKGITRYMKEVAKGKSHDVLGHVQVQLKVRGIQDCDY